MYKREFDTLLQKNSIPKALLIYGECDFQIEFYTEKILQNWADESEEILKVYFDEYDFSFAKSHLNQSSLFGGKNILFIKSDKTVPKKELDVLVELCQKNDDAFFLFQFIGDGTKAKNIVKSFGKKSGGDFIRFFKANHSEALTYLNQRSKELQVKIDSYALQHLYLMQNEGLSLSAKELEKLTLYDKTLTSADIDELVYGLGSMGIEPFIEKLLQKEDIKNAYQTLMQTSSSDEIRIINTLQNHLNMLLLFHMYIKINGNFDARAILGYPLPPQLAKKRADMSIRLSMDTFKELLSFLSEVELTMKKAKNIDKNTYLLSSLIKIQSYL